MKINQIQEKGTGLINEDFLLVNGNIFGVFDGSTSLDGLKFEDGKTGGLLASNIAGEVFKRNGDSLINLAGEANFAINQAMVENGVDTSKKSNLWSTSAAVVRVEEDEFEWIQTGDCLILAIYEDDSYKILVDGFNHDKETLLMWKHMANYTSETIHNALKDQITSVRTDANVSYGVFNGENQALDFLKSGRERLNGVRDLIIFTDGLLIPSRDPEVDRDFALFVKLFQESGLQNVKDFIRDTEKDDPACRLYPRFKAHDDIAAISLSFS